MSYSSLCPHSSINITSVSQKQCRCYDTKLCRCGASHSCQSLTSGKRTHPMPLLLHCLQQKSHKQNPIWQGFLKWLHTIISLFLRLEERIFFFSGFKRVCHLSFSLSHLLLGWDLKMFPQNSHQCCSLMMSSCVIKCHQGKSFSAFQPWRLLHITHRECSLLFTYPHLLPLSDKLLVFL